MEYKDLKNGDVIAIKWGTRNMIAIFEKFGKIYYYNALFIYAEVDMSTDEVYFKPKDCVFSYDLNDITYRLATEEEKNALYDAVGKYFTEEYDKDWYNHFTDSSYFDIQDFLFDVFCIKVEEYDNDMIYPDFVNDIQLYIWKRLCKSMGYEDEYNNEFGVELVDKKKFIAKLKKWLKINTNWDMEYDEEGRNDNYGKIDELIKYMEE